MVGYGTETVILGDGSKIVLNERSVVYLYHTHPLFVYVWLSDRVGFALKIILVVFVHLIHSIDGRVNTFSPASFLIPRIQ